MMLLAIWYDKLPSDKVEYFNKQRMSIELFGKQLGISYQLILSDLRKAGYLYNKEERVFYKNNYALVFGRKN